MSLIEGRDSEITDKGVGFIQSLPLTFLKIPRFNFTDESLKYIHNMPLNDLNMWFNITDNGLRYMNRFFIQKLNLYSCKKITGIGLGYLKQAFLTDIELAGTALTDEELINLSGLPLLRSLGLMYCKITGKGFKNCKLTTLFHLQLKQTLLTDKGLGYLGSLPSLESLDLSYCEELTGTGFKKFKYQSLTDVNLKSTSITDEGLSYLKEQRLKVLNLENSKTFAKKTALAYFPKTSLQGVDVYR